MNVDKNKYEHEVTPDKDTKLKRIYPKDYLLAATVSQFILVVLCRKIQSIKIKLNHRMIRTKSNYLLKSKRAMKSGKKKISLIHDQRISIQMLWRIQ